MILLLAEKCALCLKPLSEDGFYALGKLFHKECFRCKFCNKRLGQKFFVKNEKPCCGACFKVKSLLKPKSDGNLKNVKGRLFKTI